MRFVLIAALFVLPGIAAAPWSGGEPPLASHFVPVEMEPAFVGGLLLTSEPNGQGDKPYLGGRDLVAYEPSGALAWRETVIPDGAPYMDASVHLRVGGDDRHIVVQDTYARMWLLDAQTREILWHLPGPEDPRGNTVWSRGPDIIDGVVVAVEDGDPSASRTTAVLRGRSLTDGAVLWSHEGATGHRALLGDDLVLVGGNMMHRIEAGTGELLADHAPQDPGRGWFAGLRVVGDTIVTVAENSRESGTQGVWEKRQRFETWTPDFERKDVFTTSWYVPTPRWSERTFDYVDGTLVALFENRLVSMDLATGQEHWSLAPADLDGGAWVMDDQVLYTTMDDRNGQRFLVHAASLADGTSLGQPLALALPHWGGFRHVDGQLAMLTNVIQPGSSLPEYGILFFGDDAQPPRWPDGAGVFLHEQSHESRIHWRAMVDWNPGTYRVEGARFESGPWTHLATTSHADGEGGGYMDPALSLEVDGSHTHYRVTPFDRAGNAGPPITTQTSDDPLPPPQDGQDSGPDEPPEPYQPPEPMPTGPPDSRSDVVVFVEPDPVVAGDEMRIIVRVRAETVLPDEATAVLEGENGSALRVPLTMQQEGSDPFGWTGKGTLATPAPEPGRHVYQLRVEVRHGQQTDFLWMGEPHYVSVHVLESSPTGVRLGDLGLDRTFAGPGEELTAFVELESEGGPHEVRLRLLLDGRDEVARQDVRLHAVAPGGGVGTLVEVPFTYDGHATSLTVVASTAEGEVRRSLPIGADGASLVLSVGLLNLGNIESEGQRTIPVEVTAYNEDALDVWLRVLDDGGLSVRPLTPTTRVPAGQTVTFYLQVEAGGLAGNATAENRRLVLQAVASNAQSNVESINLVQHEEGFLGIPALGPGGVVAALAAVGAVGAGFRRRHGSG